MREKDFDWVFVSSKDERNMKNGLGLHSETVLYSCRTFMGCKESDMRRSALAIAIGAALTAGTGLIAESPAQTEQPNVSKIQKDNREIRRDNREIRAHRRRLQKEKKRLAHERIEHNAEKAEKRRQAEQAETKTDQKSVLKDEKDPNRDRAGRNADVLDRNKAASGL